ncbi:KpsF/GutQ family sugar-phosphate isomerase [Deefgea piscis]|uniref:KpsF/GutQ family sugar-phosphate isomerase n=1 Tax=Deefgea piscis TaxID=2739061 RepID=A0A6M8SM00_9NEIS|nr:KpsF/GutQ family sugar-phosphate isomerase [Deefgea piscis]QKJ66123.1 KpsF/GutQ family sugar-phosphate isomerase [Deefgea piscis]
MNDSVNVLTLARQVVAAEVSELEKMAERLDHHFSVATEMICAATGRVVVVGMGKSGIIGKKIAATLASTGTTAFFVHPGEAFHGDLGMIRPTDVVIMISNSGETEELLRILPFLQYQQNQIIAMTGGVNSTLAKHAHAVLDVGVESEACNNNLAPTSSTTAALVMGDALAVALSTMKRFKVEDFARFHPGGSLGRRLLTRVADVMHKTNLPICSPNTAMRDAVHTLSAGRLGMALVMDAGKLIGVITDGDVRRAFGAYPDLNALVVSQIMSKNPRVIGQNETFAFAEEYMQSKKLSTLVVMDSDEQVVGILQIYDFV